MWQQHRRSDRADKTPERGDEAGGLAERIAAALKRLAGLLFPAPGDALQPAPVRVRRSPHDR